MRIWNPTEYKKYHFLPPGPWVLIAVFHRQGTTVFKKMAAPLKPTLSFRKSNTVAKRISKEKDDSKISHITRSFKENICCRLIWISSRQHRQRPFLSLRCSSLCVAGACLPTLPSRGPWGMDPNYTTANNSSFLNLIVFFHLYCSWLDTAFRIRSGLIADPNVLFILSHCRIRYGSRSMLCFTQNFHIYKAINRFFIKLF